MVALSLANEVFGAEPGCVKPSINVGLLIGGKGEASWITWGPVPGMLKEMVLRPEVALAF